MTTYGPGRNPNTIANLARGPASLSNNIDTILARCVADLVTDCVLWTGYVNADGYGHVGYGGRGKTRILHRLVYELLVGPIPDGMTLDHTCEIKCCVNPDHLEPVTTGDNTRRYFANGDRRVKAAR